MRTVLLGFLNVAKAMLYLNVALAIEICEACVVFMLLWSHNISH